MCVQEALFIEGGRGIPKTFWHTQCASHFRNPPFRNPAFTSVYSSSPCMSRLSCAHQVPFHVRGREKQQFLVVSLVHYCSYDALTPEKFSAISPQKKIGVWGLIYTLEPGAISYFSETACFWCRLLKWFGALEGDLDIHRYVYIMERGSLHNMKLQNTNTHFQEEILINVLLTCTCRGGGSFEYSTSCPGVCIHNMLQQQWYHKQKSNKHFSLSSWGDLMQPLAAVFSRKPN